MNFENEIAVTRQVKEFYENLPFNYRQASSDNIELIKRKNQIKIYADFDEVLRKYKNECILDVGCGVGWLSNTVAYYYSHKAVGIDLSHNALKRARQISKGLNVTEKTSFINADLFNVTFKNKFKFICSLGALHHTFSVKEALKSIKKFLKKDGYIYIGLYHKYGREPFLGRFKLYREKISKGGQLNEKEFNEAFNIFKELNKNVRDQIFLESWFRDQVLHPHETQHTLKEMLDMLSDLGLEFISTSINAYKPVENMKEIFEQEKRYYNVSMEKNIKSKTYFPGFFTVFAKTKG